jgi:PAS domain S-box-containing protein
MLADLLERTRDRTVEDLDRRTASGGSTEPPAGSRRRRLDGLLEDLIGALRRGGEALRQPIAPFAYPGRELRERELLGRHLIEQIAEGRLEASPAETAIVARWGVEADRARLRDQNDRLRALLDDVEESAALFGPDGRILYCNTRSCERVREELGLPRGELLGKTPAELGVPPEIVIGRPIEELKQLGHRRETFEMTVGGRLKEGRFNSIYGENGQVAAVSLVIRDIHNRQLAQTRLNLLIKLNALVGILEHDELADALARVAVPELADWCAIHFIEQGRIARSFLAHRDPSKAALREALMRALPAWERHPLWQEMLTTGFQLLTEVSDELLRKMAASEARYRLFAQLGLRSLLVVPMVSRGRSPASSPSLTPKSRAGATAGTTRRWRKRWRCTRPTPSRTRA